MKKRLSFVLVIATLHFLFAVASCCHLAMCASGSAASVPPLARLLLCPLFYPVRGMISGPLVLPVLLTNSLLWGVMAERLVWGRKKLMVGRRAKSG